LLHHKILALIKAALLHKRASKATTTGYQRRLLTMIFDIFKVLLLLPDLKGILFGLELSILALKFGFKPGASLRMEPKAVEDLFG
jgi:membrane protein required for beta-lactamase induction